ncbi:uncharacterized protein LOC105211888 [Zeugodacus cucurbitae]|uniref:Uncharacterized protein C14orf119 n=1 Tax=Zeugodacus cucurbitae TaxID=28588 RepID=A0A0A1WHK1_ZEUCU|nr:uncharacterized protein LOC105211888 [Zeugodacus cucurbitae]XP_054090858.1 uncharacterized protein LOC105211888 [Zeugodacus cucurbitae]
MSMNNLSIDGEFRYIIQWFNEWSELQRDDFVPVLLEYLQQEGSNGVYMNGIVNSVSQTNIQDKPMSLFQCRIKLFREWNKKWPSDLKLKLQEKVTEIDSKVGEKITKEITPTAVEQVNVCNGDAVAIETHHEVNEGDEEKKITAEIAVEANEVAEVPTNLESHIVEALNNETPVDDNNSNENVDNQIADTTPTTSTVTVTAIENSIDNAQLQLEPDEQVQIPAESALEENITVVDSIATTTATVA